MDNSTASITFGEFSTMYLNDIRRSITYNTLLGYQQAINAFSELKDMRLVDITHSDIQAIFNSLPLKASTANLYLVKIKTIFKRALSPYELITKDPTSGIQPLKIKGKRKNKRPFKRAFRSDFGSVLNPEIILYIRRAVSPLLPGLELAR